MLIPVSAIIPTYNRNVPLLATLKTVASQAIQFSEIIVIDASSDDATYILCEVTGIDGLISEIVYEKAIVKGAASQRNQGVSLAKNPFIAFMDDDVYLEEFCIERLWNCFRSYPDAGGVSAMITNQKYEPIGKLTRFMCWLLGGESLSSYAGKCIGPAWNFLPSDDASLPEYAPVDWLNLGLTIYRTQALPTPPFQNHFKGYSTMEDLTLSLTVGKEWGLFNARTARIYHDSQPGVHKNNVQELQKMELTNRHFIMTSILQQTRTRDYFRLAGLELFKIVSFLRGVQGWRKLPSVIMGKLNAIKDIKNKTH